MAYARKTEENLRDLVWLEFDEELTLAECAARLKVSDRTIYNWRNSDEYKNALAGYVNELEQEAVPRALTLLVRLVKQGDYHAANTLMNIYKGAKTRLEGEVGIDVLLRNAVNGSGNGKPS